MNTMLLKTTLVMPLLASLATAAPIAWPAAAIEDRTGLQRSRTTLGMSGEPDMNQYKSSQARQSALKEAAAAGEAWIRLVMKREGLGGEA